MSLNSFGCPLSTRESYLHNVNSKMSHKTESSDKHLHSSGIWPMASYINHCCNSNARRAFIGDMMIVRATRDLAPGTEITFWYQSPKTDGYDERQKKLQHWGFKCDCSMCQDEKLTKRSVLTKRESLRADALRIFRSEKGANAAKIEVILARLADTYHRPTLEVPRLSIWDPLLVLAELYSYQQQPAKVINCALGVLTSLGYVIDGGNLPRISGMPMVVKIWGLMQSPLITCWMLLSHAYRLVAPDLEAQAEEYARISYMICMGEDETFEETKGKLSQLNLLY